MTWWANTSRQLLLLPNLISIGRAVAGLLLPYLILAPSFWLHVLAAVVYTIAAISDYYDGVIARKQGLVSDIGKILDPLADKILILGPLAAFVALGFYSIWWVALIFAREIIITFCRFGWLYEGKAIGAEMLGKYKLCVQVITVSFSLLYLLCLELPINGALHTITMISLLLTVFMTLLSGYTFLLSNLQNLSSPGFARFTAALGVGLIPKAPGTWGSILGALLAALTHVNTLIYWISFAILFLAGWWAVSKLDLRKHEDPQYVVVDEACGMFLAMMAIEVSAASLIVAFVLFRLFDIFKPFPLKRLERFPGYWGIMLDDLGAGLYTWLVMIIFF